MAREADTAGLCPHSEGICCSYTSYPHQPVVCQLWKPPFEASAKFPKSPIWPLSPPQAVPHFIITFSVTISFPRCFLNSLPGLPFPYPEALFCPDILRDSAGCQVDTSVIPALGELRQEDGNFQAHLSYIVRRLCGVLFCFDTTYNVRRVSMEGSPHHVACLWRTILFPPRDV